MLETLMHGATGLLLPGDVAAWRDAILKLASDPLQRTQRIASGRYWVEHNFSAEVIAQHFVELLEK